MTTPTPAPTRTPHPIAATIVTILVIVGGTILAGGIVMGVATSSVWPALIGLGTAGATLVVCVLIAASLSRPRRQ